MTKSVFCHNKHVCVTKLLSQQKSYLWQLPPMIQESALAVGISNLPGVMFITPPCSELFPYNLFWQFKQKCHPDKQSFILNAQSTIKNQLSIYQVGIFVWIANFSWTQTFEHMVSAGTDHNKFTSKPQCSAHTMIQFMLFSMDTQQSHSFTNNTNIIVLLIQSFW